LKDAIKNACRKIPPITRDADTNPFTLRSTDPLHTTEPSSETRPIDANIREPHSESSETRPIDTNLRERSLTQESSEPCSLTQESSEPRSLTQESSEPQPSTQESQLSQLSEHQKKFEKKSKKSRRS
jgi:hypothetical protein